MNPREKKAPRKKPRAESRPQTPRHAWLLLALAAAALLAWSNSFTAELIFDNRMLIGMDPRIRAVTMENLRNILTQDYWAAFHPSALYRPFATLTYLFNYAILGNAADPAGYHWINLALHIANMVLVYLLALRTLARADLALWIAAVWGLHPVLTEAVTNIVGRTDELAAFGVLAGLLCHIQAASAGRRKPAWLAALAVAAGIGIFSKESAIALVAVMTLYDLSFQKRGTWRNSLAGYVAAAVPFLAFFWLRFQVFSHARPFHFPVTDNPIAGADFWTGRLTAIHVIGKYLGVLCWPATLACDHSYNDIPLVTWRALPALLLCLTALAAAIAAWRDHRPVSWFVLFFFATLAPVSNLVIPTGTIMAERLLYLPAIGFSGCLVLAVYAAAARFRLPRYTAPALLAATGLIFTIRTYSRNTDWQNAIALWTSAVAAAPDSYKTHTMLAAAWADTGDAGLRHAIAEVTRARRIMDALPDAQKTPLPYIDAGSYYGQQGDLDKALESLQRARAIEAANNRAGGTGAIWYELYVHLGGVYLKKNEFDKALEFLQYGRDRHPAPEFFEQISLVYFQKGDLRRAAVTLHEGRILFPAHPRFDSALRVLYRQIDPGGCEQGLELTCPVVRQDACAAARNVSPLRRRFPQLAAGEPPCEAP